MTPHNQTLAYLALAFCLLSAPIQAADVRDLLDADRLIRHLKADDSQKSHIAARVTTLRSIVAQYQWERAKRLCEAALWQGMIPRAGALHTLRKNARDSVDAALDTLKTGLDEKQIERIDKILKGRDNILDHPVAESPFYHVANSPLFAEFQNRTTAYQVALPGAGAAESPWSYAQLLKTWSVRGYIPAMRPIDDVNQAPSIAEHPDLQTRVLPTSQRARIVQSPLMFSATLLVPQLGRAEFDLLQTHYASDSTWEEYVQNNRMNEAIVIRLKLNTPYAETFLDLNRWIIYLEDGDGTGYEPQRIDTRAFYPLEAVSIAVPGREIEVTDVFGTYFSPMPGERERFYLEGPSQVTYVGNEKLLQLSFPGHTIQGKPIVTEQTQYLKLVLQSRETEFGRSELTWDLRRPKSSVRPPKD